MRHAKLQRITRRACGAAFAALLLITTGTAQAGRGHGHNSEDWARVTHVEPIYRTVTVSEPQRECWTEEVHHAGHGSTGGTIIGGLIGGVIGHQVGRRINRGRGRHAATVAGAVIGAAVGHGHNSRHGGGYVDYEKRCQTSTVSHTEERLDGYRVSYRYRGRDYTTHTSEHPGRRIRVRVQLTPLVH